MVHSLASIMAEHRFLDIDGFGHPDDSDFAWARRELAAHAVVIEALAAWLRPRVRASRSFRPATMIRDVLNDVWTSRTTRPRRVPLGVLMAIALCAGYAWRRQRGRVVVGMNASDLRALEVRPGARCAA